MKSLRILLVISALCSASILFAQDKLVAKNGITENVKVIEVNDEFVVYKLFSNQDGPSYKMRKSNVTKIIYQNGTVDSNMSESGPADNRRSSRTPKAPPSAPEAPAAPMPQEGPMPIFNNVKDYGHNLVTLEMISLILNEVDFSYERILKSGFVGIEVPFYVGMGKVEDENYLREYNTTFKTGVDLNLYPTGQGRVKYFVGPGFRFGTVYNTYSTFTPNPVTLGPSVSEYKFQDFRYFGFQINNGVLFQPTQTFAISFQLALGIRRLTPQEGPATRVRVDNYGGLQVNLGIRF